MELYQTKIVKMKQELPWLEHLPARLLEAESDLSIEHSNGDVKNSMEELDEIPEKDQDIASEETSDEKIPESEEDDNPQERYLSDAMPPKKKTAWSKKEMPRNDFRNMPEPRNCNGPPITPTGIFNIFFDDDVISMIVRNTNL